MIHHFFIFTFYGTIIFSYNNTGIIYPVCSPVVQTSWNSTILFKSKRLYQLPNLPRSLSISEKRHHLDWLLSHSLKKNIEPMLWRVIAIGKNAKWIFVRMHSESLLPKPSSRVWNYLLTEIDASFHDIIIPKTPNQRSRNIRGTVLNHFEALGISNWESHSKQKALA